MSSRSAAAGGVLAVGLYVPGWADPRGLPVAGLDEDVTTMAVSAAQLALEQGGAEPVTAVELVVREPGQLLGNVAETVLRALDLALDLPFRTVLGGSPEVLAALTVAAAGTLVIAVDPLTPSSAGAVLIGGTEPNVRAAGARRISAPLRTVAGDAREAVYDDQRFLRDVAWASALELATDVAELIIAGVPADLAPKLRPGATGTRARGPAGAVEALAEALRRQGPAVTVIGAENGTAAAVAVAPGTAPVHRSARPPLSAPPSWEPQSEAGLALALPAYTRAFDAKIGLLASQDPDGTLRHPPRSWVAGAPGAKPSTRPLPRSGVVYSQTTIHAPVPGKRTPYTLAVVALDGVAVRVLAPVTDAQPGSTTIGTPGQMVLRRVAIRQGVSDYGYAFQPQEVTP